MNDDTLRRRIAQLVADSSKMVLSLHAKNQMRRRKVLPTQVLHVLRKGYIVEHAHRNTKGNWQCTLEGLVAGDRIKVAAALVGDSSASVVVITVMN